MASALGFSTKLRTVPGKTKAFLPAEKSRALDLLHTQYAIPKRSFNRIA